MSRLVDYFPLNYTIDNRAHSLTHSLTLPSCSHAHTQRWVDPFFDLEQFHTKPPVEDELMLEAEKDEELRRLASERVLSSMMPKWVEKEASDCESSALLSTSFSFFSFFSSQYFYLT